MSRPPVDIVVPFVGSDASLQAMVDRLASLALLPGDSATIADNRSGATAGTTDQRGPVRVLGAPGLPSSYFARNRGASLGTNPWLIFLDADVTPPPELIDEYFAVEPPDDVGILIGGIQDEQPERRSAVEEHAFRRGSVGHTTTARDDGFTFAQTANVAVRRLSFEQVGGFTETVRSGGDADLCFRVQAAGWRMEPRHHALVTHHNRTTLKGFVRQYLRYGSGSAWLERAHPGFSPRPNPVRVAVSLAAAIVRATGALLRGRRLDAEVFLLDGVQKAAFVAGRLASNRVAPPS